MNAPALLDHLRTLGVAVRVAGDKLQLEPGSLVPESMVEEIRAVKPAMIALIEASGPMPEPSSGGEMPTLPDRVQRLVDRFIAGQTWLGSVRETLLAQTDAGVGSTLEHRYTDGLLQLAAVERLLRFTCSQFKGCARGELGPCDSLAVLRCEYCASNTGPQEAPHG